MLTPSLWQRAFLARPDHFVNAKIWANHNNLLRAILRGEEKGTGASENSAPTTYRGFDIPAKELLLGDIVGRNEALLFKKLPDRPIDDIQWILEQIKVCHFVRQLSAISDV